MRRELEFEEGDKVYLKISPMKGVMRFGKKGKLSPRYVGTMKSCKELVRLLMGYGFLVNWLRFIRFFMFL